MNKTRPIGRGVDLDDKSCSEIMTFLGRERPANLKSTHHKWIIIEKRNQWNSYPETNYVECGLCGLLTIQTRTKKENK